MPANPPPRSPGDGTGRYQYDPDWFGASRDDVPEPPGTGAPGPRPDAAPGPHGGGAPGPQSSGAPGLQSSGAPGLQSSGAPGWQGGGAPGSRGHGPTRDDWPPGAGPWDGAAPDPRYPVGGGPMPDASSNVDWFGAAPPPDPAPSGPASGDFAPGPAPAATPGGFAPGPPPGGFVPDPAPDGFAPGAAPGAASGEFAPGAVPGGSGTGASVPGGVAPAGPGRFGPIDPGTGGPGTGGPGTDAPRFGPAPPGGTPTYPSAPEPSGEPMAPRFGGGRTGGFGPAGGAEPDPFADLRAPAPRYEPEPTGPARAGHYADPVGRDGNPESPEPDRGPWPAAGGDWFAPPHHDDRPAGDVAAAQPGFVDAGPVARSRYDIEDATAAQPRYDGDASRSAVRPGRPDTAPYGDAPGPAEPYPIARHDAAPGDPYPAEPPYGRRSGDAEPPGAGAPGAWPGDAEPSGAGTPGAWPGGDPPYGAPSAPPRPQAPSGAPQPEPPYGEPPRTPHATAPGEHDPYGEAGPTERHDAAPPAPGPPPAPSGSPAPGVPPAPGAPGGEVAPGGGAAAGTLEQVPADRAAAAVNAVVAAVLFGALLVAGRLAPPSNLVACALVQVVLVLSWVFGTRRPGPAVVAVVALGGGFVADWFGQYGAAVSLAPFGYVLAGGLLAASAGQLARGGGRTRITDSLASTMFAVTCTVAVPAVLMLARLDQGPSAVLPLLGAAGAAVLVARLVDLAWHAPRASAPVARGVIGVVAGGVVAGTAVGFGLGQEAGLPGLHAAVAGLLMGLAAVLADVGVSFGSSGRELSGEPRHGWPARFVLGPAVAASLAAPVAFVLGWLVLLPPQ